MSIITSPVYYPYNPFLWHLLIFSVTLTGGSPNYEVPENHRIVQRKKPLGSRYYAEIDLGILRVTNNILDL